MKKLLAALIVGLCVSSAQAFPVYNDSAGDVFTGAGGGILDILSVEVTDDGTDINFKFNHAGDNTSPNDWGKYMVIIDSVPGGDPVDNGWHRPISMPSGADYWLGSWLDSGTGMELYKYNAGWPFPPDYATWNGATNIGVINRTPSSFAIKARLSDLGLGAGQTFCFDAFSSGGGGTDGAVDSLGNPAQQVADWGDHSDAHPVCYTTTPEPTTLGLLAFAGLALIRRRR